MNDRIIYVTRDIERALGVLPSADYLIVANDSEYARSVKEKYPDFVLLIDSPVPLDTFGILEKEETAAFIEKAVNQKKYSSGLSTRPAGRQAEDFRLAKDKPNIIVFKSTARIEEFCAKNGWKLLNPPSALAEKIENKITQTEWLGELAELLPRFDIAPAREINWQKKTLVLQFAHAHTGLGTVLVNNEKELKEIQRQFPDRPIKASEYIKGPTFTVNISVQGLPLDKLNTRATLGQAKYKGYPWTIIGNPSYQITGISPLTDNPFATVGNDWGLPYTLLSERHLEELRNIAKKVGAKMRDSGWRGLFGIDVIYDEERDQLKLIEINARQPASTTYESQLQSRFRGHGLVGATIFEAHLAALTESKDVHSTKPVQGLPLDKQIEINDGAQIVQRVTKSLSNMSSWTEKVAALNAAGYIAIPYPNTKPNSDLLRIQSDKCLMEGHGKWNARGEKIIEILEK